MQTRKQRYLQKSWYCSEWQPRHEKGCLGNKNIGIATLFRNATGGGFHQFGF